MKMFNVNGEELVHNLHGDIGLHPVDVKVPDLEKKKKSGVTKGNKCIVQESEVTGNSHVLKALTTPLFWWTNKEGQQYVYCENDYEIIHEGPEQEHGTQRVQAGVREIRHEVEFDPWSRLLRQVRD